jgi:hypothetical protein
VHNNTWVICCPGPSINLYDTKKRITQVNPNVKVAVNGAILLDSTFDYWAVIDLEVFESIFKLTSGLGLGFPTLWIPAYWQEHISLGYPQLNTFFNSFKNLTYPAKKSTDLRQIMPFGQSISWTEYTLFSAIALAIKKDAKTIRIFGADMSGQGYFKPGFINTRTRHTEDRWKEERHWFNEIVQLCAQHNIIITKEETNKVNA